MNNLFVIPRNDIMVSAGVPKSPIGSISKAYADRYSEKQGSGFCKTTSRRSRWKIGQRIQHVILYPSLNTVSSEHERLDVDIVLCESPVGVPIVKPAEPKRINGDVMVHEPPRCGIRFRPSARQNFQLSLHFFTAFLHCIRTPASCNTVL